jgi:Na+/H+ antiporter NhaD/arsenite permease-like protein
MEEQRVDVFLMLLIALITVGAVMYLSLVDFTRHGETKIPVLGISAVAVWLLVAVKGTDHHPLREVFGEAVLETALLIFFLLFAMMIVEFVTGEGLFDYVKQRMMEQGGSDRIQHRKLMNRLFPLSGVLDNVAATIIVRAIGLRIFQGDNLVVALTSTAIVANIGGAGTFLGDPPPLLFWIAGKYVWWEILLFGLPITIVMYFVWMWFADRQISEDDTTGMVVDNGEEPIIFGRDEKILIGSALLSFVWAVVANLLGFSPMWGLFAGIMVTELLRYILHHRHQQTKFSNSLLATFHHVEHETLLTFLGLLMLVFGCRAAGILDILSHFAFGDDPSPARIFAVVTGFALASALFDNVALAAMLLTVIKTGSGMVWVIASVLLSTGGCFLPIGSAAGILVMGTREVKGQLTFKRYLKITTAGMAAAFGVGVVLLAIQYIVYLAVTRNPV